MPKGPYKNHIPKTETIVARVTPELKSAVRSLAAELDTSSLSEAAVQAIQYGILYYYYVKKEDLP